MSKQMAPSNPTVEERMQRRRRLGEHIRSLRMQAEMTQGQLGEALANTSASDFAIPQTTISRWETGAVELEVEQIYAIEEVLKASHGQLLAAAGYVKAEIAPGTVEEAIMVDPSLHPSVREDVIRIYRSYVDTSKNLLEAEERFIRLGGKARPRKSGK